VAAGEPMTPIVIDYDMLLAEHAERESQATLDALHALPEIGVEAPIGLRQRVTLGVVTGMMLTACPPPGACGWCEKWFT
jgi:hypothetical protein